MEKVTLSPFQIIGISIRTTNQNNQAATDIAQLWQRFLSENIAAQIPSKVDDTVYSLYTDYEGDHTQPYTAVLGCKVESVDVVPDGFTSHTISGGIYSKTSARGNLMEGLVVSHWNAIFEMNLDRTFNSDFEVFGEKAQNPSDAEVGFYVGVNS